MPHDHSNLTVNIGHILLDQSIIIHPLKPVPHSECLVQHAQSTLFKRCSCVYDPFDRFTCYVINTACFELPLVIMLHCSPLVVSFIFRSNLSLLGRSSRTDRCKYFSPLRKLKCISSTRRLCTTGCRDQIYQLGPSGVKRRDDAMLQVTC